MIVFRILIVFDDRQYEIKAERRNRYIHTRRKTQLQQSVVPQPLGHQAKIPFRVLDISALKRFVPKQHLISAVHRIQRLFSPRTILIMLVQCNSATSSLRFRKFFATSRLLPPPAILLRDKSFLLCGSHIKSLSGKHTLPANTAIPTDAYNHTRHFCLYAQNTSPQNFFPLFRNVLSNPPNALRILSIPPSPLPLQNPDIQIQQLPPTYRL